MQNSEDKKPHNNESSNQNTISIGEIDEDSTNIERAVPLSDADVMGFTSLKGRGNSVVLEFGYIKNNKTEDVIIDCRKRLPEPMARDLYEKLKMHFEITRE